MLWCIAEPMWILFERCPHYHMKRHVSYSDGGSTAWEYFINQLVSDELPAHMREYSESWAGDDFGLARSMSSRVNADKAGHFNPGLRVLVEWIHYVTGQRSACPDLQAPRPLQVLAVMDSAAITVTCVSMGGDQLAALTLDGEATVSVLLASIRQQLPLETGAWSLVLPTGEILDEAQAEAEVRVVFGCAAPTEANDDTAAERGAAAFRDTAAAAPS